MPDFYDNPYEYFNSFNKYYKEAQRTYENLKHAGEAVGSFYNWYNNPNRKDKPTMSAKTGNLRGKGKGTQFARLTDLPHTQAFKEYMFNGPIKHIHYKSQIPRALKQMYKPITILGFREMDITSPFGGQVAEGYFDIWCTREVAHQRSLSREHIGTQIATNTGQGLMNWTSVVHKDHHKFQIANASNSPIVIEIFVLQYKDDGGSGERLEDWLDVTEYESGAAGFTTANNLSQFTNVIDRKSPRFNPMKDRRSIRDNYYLLDKRNLALGPGQNTSYSLNLGGDLVLSNSRLEECITTNYAVTTSYYPSTMSVGREYLRGYSKVVYFRTYCKLLSEQSGTTVTTGDDIGVNIAKILVREELTRTIGCYPITRHHISNPSANDLENTGTTSNQGGGYKTVGADRIYYGDYKRLTNPVFQDIENDAPKFGNTTT